MPYEHTQLPGGKFLTKLFGIEKALQSKGFEPRPSNNKKKGNREVIPGIEERNGRKYFVAPKGHRPKTFIGQIGRVREGLAMHEAGDMDGSSGTDSEYSTASEDERPRDRRNGAGVAGMRAPPIRPRDRVDEYRLAEGTESRQNAHSRAQANTQKPTSNRGERVYPHSQPTDRAFATGRDQRSNSLTRRPSTRSRGSGDATTPQGSAHPRRQGSRGQFYKRPPPPRESTRTDERQRGQVRKTTRFRVTFEDD